MTFLAGLYLCMCEAECVCVGGGGVVFGNSAFCATRTYAGLHNSASRVVGFH